MSNIIHHSSDVDARNNRVLTEIINDVAPQPPAYMIRQLTAHTWALWKWNVMTQCYVFPFPRAQYIRSEAEAMEWMKSEAFGSSYAMDMSVFEPLTESGPVLDFDADCNPINRDGK